MTDWPVTSNFFAEFSALDFGGGRLMSEIKPIIRELQWPSLCGRGWADLPIASTVVAR